MSLQSFTRRINNLHQSKLIQRHRETPMTFVVLPYKNHSGEVCRCVSPTIADMGTHYHIGYHPAPGMSEQIDALILQQRARS